jgi:hypothetical protein
MVLDMSKTTPADCTAPVEVVSMRAPKVPADLVELLRAELSALGYAVPRQARRAEGVVVS